MAKTESDRQIFNLAIPNILSNLSVPVLSSVDTALVGHLPSPVYIGAVAVGSMIFNFVYWGFGFLRMGTTGLTAQAFGNDNQHEMRLLLWRALIVAVGIGLVLIVLQTPIVLVALGLINASAEVEKNARIYFAIRIFAAPATLALYAIHGWFLGMQNARLPLIITVALNLANILFNVLFVLVLHMKADGVALGTVVAQYLGILLSFYFLIRRYRPYLRVPPFKEIIAWQAILRFVKINFDIFIRTLSLIFVFSFFTAESASLGDVPLAANSILIQLWMIFSYGIDGFAFAAESLVGKYLGAKKREMLIAIIRRTFIFGSGLGLIFSIVYGIFHTLIPRFFTNNSLVLDAVQTVILWTIVAPFVNSFCYIWDGIYLGATQSKALRNAMLFSTLVIYLPAHYLLRPIWGNHGMWFALLLFMIVRAISLGLLSKKYLNIAPRELLNLRSA